MSVYASKREPSPVQFLTDMTNLIYYLSDFVCKRYGDRKSKGYSPYDYMGNRVLGEAYNAYNYMQIANNIFISDSYCEQDANLRRELFQKAEGSLVTLANAFFIYVNCIDNNAKINAKKKDQIITYVSVQCYTIKGYITKIIKRDIEKVNKIKTRIYNNNSNKVIATEKLENGKVVPILTIKENKK